MMLGSGPVLGPMSVLILRQFKKVLLASTPLGCVFVKGHQAV